MLPLPSFKKVYTGLHQTCWHTLTHHKIPFSVWCTQSSVLASSDHRTCLPADFRVALIPSGKLQPSWYVRFFKSDSSIKFSMVNLRQNFQHLLPSLASLHAYLISEDSLLLEGLQLCHALSISRCKSNFWLWWYVKKRIIIVFLMLQWMTNERHEIPSKLDVK